MNKFVNDVRNFFRGVLPFILITGACFLILTLVETVNNNTVDAEVKLGLEHGLKVKQVFFYSDARCYKEARQARLAFERGLSFDEVELFFKPNVSSVVMEKMIKLFELGFSKEKIEFLVKHKNYQRNLNLLIATLRSGVPLEKIKITTYPDMSFSLLKRALKDVRKYSRDELIKIYR